MAARSSPTASTSGPSQSTNPSRQPTLPANRHLLLQYDWHGDWNYTLPPEPDTPDTS